MISQQFRSGMKGLTSWLQRHEHPITMFVIADQCASEEFVQMMNDLCSTFGDRITIGCHGLHHRSWSAWPEDREAFAQDLETSVTILKQHFPQHFRPWFRAPAGYIASWMIPVLVEQGFTVDSSINPSWLVQSKIWQGRIMEICPNNSSCNIDGRTSMENPFFTTNLRTCPTHYGASLECQRSVETISKTAQR